MEVVNSIFSNHIEIHAFVLGISFGMLIILTWKESRLMSYSIIGSALMIVMFGPLSYALKQPYLKPWYFLFAMASTSTLGKTIGKAIHLRLLPRRAVSTNE